MSEPSLETKIAELRGETNANFEQLKGQLGKVDTKLDGQGKQTEASFSMVRDLIKQQADNIKGLDARESRDRDELRHEIDRERTDRQKEDEKLRTALTGVQIGMGKIAGIGTVGGIVAGSVVAAIFKISGSG